MDITNVEGGLIEENKESFELNKENLAIFKDLLHQAAKWIKQEKARAKIMKKEYFEEADMWKRKRQEHYKKVDKVKADIEEAKILQEKLLVQSYLKLVEQGKISETPSKTEEQDSLGQESTISIQKSGSIDRYTRDLIFQLIN